MRRAHALLLAVSLLLASHPGCASVTGLVTGALTGVVDAPAQVYRHNRGELDRHPEYWVFNVLIVGPLGFVAGPLVGFAKGVALDIEWLLDEIGYDDAFTTYKAPSVWRPYTIHW